MIYKDIVGRYSIGFKEYNFIIIQNTVSPPRFSFTIHRVVALRWCSHVVGILSQFVLPPWSYITEQLCLNTSVCPICSISRIIVRF